MVSNLQDEREDPSKVSEDAILDSLFYACDGHNIGLVPVSRLIEYLRDAISNGTEEVTLSHSPAAKPTFWNFALRSFQL